MPHVSRRSVRASLLGVAAALVCATAAPLTRAESPTIEPIRIDYAAERTCPTYEDFVVNVRRYTTKWRPAEQDAAHRTFRVVLAKRAASSSTAGKLELEGGGASSFTREIVGPDCGAVARALAIALAVLIDPEADLSGSGPPTKPPPHVAEADDLETPQKPTELPIRPPAPHGVRPREADRPRPAKIARTAPHVAIEGSVGLTSAVVTGFLPVIGAAVELDPFPAGLSRWPRWLRPSIALGIRQSAPREIERSGMSSEFLWTAGVVRICPARWAAFEDRLELVPCFEMNAGALRADVSGSRDSRSSVRPWLDMGGSANLKWHVRDPWFIGAMFAIAAPITRYRFELATSASVSQAPSLGIAFGPYAGVRF